MSTEKDWKLFQKKVGDWQESYMDCLERSYVALLEGDELPSEKFYKLQQRIKEDRKQPGISFEINRHHMDDLIFYFLREGIITFDDLIEFSSDLMDEVKEDYERYQKRLKRLDENQ